MRKASLAIVALLAVLAIVPGARALESAPVASPRATATLVTETDAYAVGKPFRAGLRLRLAPGWHTYWQNPGDAGAAPNLTLSLPPGATASPIAWPAPRREAEGPVVTFAYTSEVLLPVTVTPPPGGGPVAIEAQADWLVCEKICVPEQGSFRLTLAPGGAAPSAEAPLFAAADARTPRASPFAARHAPDGTLILTGAGLSRETVRDAWFFPATWGAIDQNAAQTASVGDGLLSLTLRAAEGAKPGDPLRGVLGLRDPNGGETFLEVVAEPGPAAAPPVAEAALPLGRTLLFALLGGLILNLMPCVFPVLAMKAFAFARLSGAARRDVRLHAASYVAGVMAMFLAFGCLLLGLRAAGHAAGWGFQFQSPVFVAGMAWLLFAVGLNLSGVFDASMRVAGVGQSLAGRGGHVGSFFTGLLAVVVATPCTAPFMASALAAGLAGSAAVTLGVFLALGIGLAAPYATLAVAPGLARLLPRPGEWMDLLKQVLAFPMYAATLWLVWVAAEQSGSTGVLVVGSGLLLFGFAAWALGCAQRSARGGRRIGAIAALAAVAAAVGILAISPGATPRARVAESGSEAYTAARLGELRGQGRPVFVNMTAAWCVTCLVNERVALGPGSVREAFAKQGVAYLKGDWTRADPGITAFLREHGREGVPLYVFYPAGGAPRILPQVLTENVVLDALHQAGT